MRASSALRAIALLAFVSMTWAAVLALAPPRRVLFVDANVLTMDARESRASALLVVGERIAGVGDEASLAPLLDGSETRTTLGGRTLMPGFVDAHSHFPAASLGRLGVDLAPTLLGGVTDLDSLFARLVEAAEAIGEDEPERWLLGFDYDDSALAEARHPTRAELDLLVPDRPVWLRHRSGHMGVGNSRALVALGPEADAVADGLLQEEAAPPLRRLLAGVPLGTRLDAVREACEIYLARGVTTVQNGHADRVSRRLLAWARRANLFPVRIVLWPAGDEGNGIASSSIGRWFDRAGLDDEDLRVGAVKLIADGSPQGMTARLSSPYPASSGLPDDYRGLATLDAATLDPLVDEHHGAGRQLAIHANGDGAIDTALDALALAQRRTPRPDARHLIVHAQTVRTDQLERMAALGVEAAFFPSHVLYWGDWHRDRALGPERAERISPLAEADALGVDWSIHSDAPVTPMRPFEMMQSATERRTRSGRVLGARFRVSRARALRALTIDAARQNFLDHDRGSLEPGKLADLIVLSGDPLSVDDPETLEVDEVWIGGRSVRRYVGGVRR